MIRETRDLRRLCRLDGSTEALLETALELLPVTREEVFRLAACYRIAHAAELDAIVSQGASRETTIAAFASVAPQPSPFLRSERSMASITSSKTWSEDMERGLRIVGCADFTGDIMDLRGGSFAALGAGNARKVPVARPASSFRRSLCSLLRLNLRLRQLTSDGSPLQDATAVLEADGNLVNARDPALWTVRHHLARAVRARENSGAFAALTREGGMALWRELAAAGLVLVDYVDTDQRHYIIAVRARDNEFSALALSGPEQRVLEGMLRGYSNKVIADGLAVSCAAVSVTAGRALHKLGVKSISELSVVARSRTSLVLSEWSMDGELLTAVGYDANTAECLAALSPGERAVARAALEGDSLSDIAFSRGASVRTIANQLASCYRKLGVSGRREMMAKLMRGEN